MRDEEPPHRRVGQRRGFGTTSGRPSRPSPASSSLIHLRTAAPRARGAARRGEGVASTTTSPWPSWPTAVDRVETRGARCRALGADHVHRARRAVEAPWSGVSRADGRRAAVVTSSRPSASSSAAQRQQAELTLRELAVRTNVSNPYLSQIERGLHEPSVRVLKAIAGALNLSAESLLAAGGLLEGGDPVDRHGPRRWRRPCGADPAPQRRSASRPAERLPELRRGRQPSQQAAHGRGAKGAAPSGSRRHSMASPAARRDERLAGVGSGGLGGLDDLLGRWRSRRRAPRSRGPR